MIEAVNALLGLMSPEQRKASCFPVGSQQWRHWQNTELYVEHYGLRLDEVSEPLRDAVHGGAARQHERARLRAVARRDEAQPLPRRPRRRAGGDGRMELHLLPVRRAVDERALGLAVLRPSPRAQLLRAGRADGADAGVLGRRAELCRPRAVQGHPAVPGRGARGLEADALVLGRSSRSAPSSRIR